MLTTNVHISWLPKAITFALSLAAGASAVYWGLKEWRLQVQPDVSVSPLKSALVTTSMVARALGSMPETAKEMAPPPDTRYALVGIIANRSGGGVALISVDGKAAKPVRVGAFVDDRLLLQSVKGRRAVLSRGVDNPTEVILDLAKPGK